MAIKVHNQDPVRSRQFTNACDLIEKYAYAKTATGELIRTAPEHGYTARPYYACGEAAENGGGWGLAAMRPTAT